MSIHTEAIANRYVRIKHKGKEFVAIQTGTGKGVDGVNYVMIAPHFIFVDEDIQEITKKEYFIGKLEGNEFRSDS